jgi:hypothetical protein
VVSCPLKKDGTLNVTPLSSNIIFAGNNLFPCVRRLAAYIFGSMVCCIISLKVVKTNYKTFSKILLKM